MAALASFVDSITGIQQAFHVLLLDRLERLNRGIVKSVCGIFSSVPFALTTVSTESHMTSEPGSTIESIMSFMVAVVRNSCSCCPGCWACLAVQPEAARITTLTKAKNKYFRIATFLQN